MSNQLEFEIGLDRVKMYYELASQTLKKTEKFLKDEEVFIDFDSNRSTMFAELIGKKTFFNRFTDAGLHCVIYYYDGQEVEECWHVPVELIKFKEY